jgi:cytochrome c556
MSEADWQRLVDAARSIIRSGEQIRAGGNGDYDADWASTPDWQAYLDTMIGAATDASDAATRQDLDALLQANDVLYPPCEECHLQFHPGVREQEFN